MRNAETIEALLIEKLDSSHVKTKEGKYQYIEGWHAIQESNRIFGALNWDRQTTNLKEVCRYQNANGNHVVGFEAKVVVTVHVPDLPPVVREGTGYGSGIAKDLFAAIESAGKEAETDAMKRAMMTLGNPLGLALYDKKRENIEDSSQKPKANEKPKPTAEERYNIAINTIKNAKTEAAFRKLTDSQNYRALLSDLDGKPEKVTLMNAASKRYEELTEHTHTTH